MFTKLTEISTSYQNTRRLVLDRVTLDWKLLHFWNRISVNFELPSLPFFFFKAHCCTFWVFAFVGLPNRWQKKKTNPKKKEQEEWVVWLDGWQGDRFPNRLIPLPPSAAAAECRKQSEQLRVFPAGCSSHKHQRQHALKRQYCLLSCLCICEMHPQTAPLTPHFPPGLCKLSLTHIRRSKGQGEPKPGS